MSGIIVKSPVYVLIFASFVRTSKYGPWSDTLLMVRAIEKSGTIYQSARCNIPEGLNIQVLIFNEFCTIPKRAPPPTLFVFLQLFC